MAMKRFLDEREGDRAHVQQLASNTTLGSLASVRMQSSECTLVAHGAIVRGGKACGRLQNSRITYST